MTYTFRFGPVLEAYGDLLAGAWLTLQLSTSAMLLGLVVAIVCAWAKTSGPEPLRWMVECYIEIIRNTPVPGADLLHLLRRFLPAGVRSLRTPRRCWRW